MAERVEMTLVSRDEGAIPTEVLLGTLQRDDFLKDLRPAEAVVAKVDLDALPDDVAPLDEITRRLEGTGWKLVLVASRP